MTEIMYIRKQRDEFCVRDLKPGMVVPIGKKTARVRRLTVMNGSNGEPPAMIGGGRLPSAMAVKVEFEDHEALITHPGIVVPLPHTHSWLKWLNRYLPLNAL